MPQPHLLFDDKDDVDARPCPRPPAGSPLETFRAMTPEEREKHVAEYREGFKINPCN